MKKIFWISSVLLLTVCLLIYGLICLNPKYSVHSWDTTDESPTINISAEILTRKRVDVGESLDVRIYFGPLDQFDVSTITIKTSSPDFLIVTPDGSAYSNRVSYDIASLGDAKYGIRYNSDKKVIEYEYSEDYSFQYIGTITEETGRITFTIFAEALAPDAKEQYCGVDVWIYYKIKNGKMWLSTRRPYAINLD